MDGAAVTCWYSVFREAYKYSCKYLILTLSVILTSLFTVWVYERPQIYKLLFKRSKLSNTLSPVQSDDHHEEECVQSPIEEANDTLMVKKIRELPREEVK